MEPDFGRLRVKTAQWTLAEDSELCTILENFTKACTERSTQIEQRIGNITKNVNKLDAIVEAINGRLELLTCTRFVEQKIAEDEYRPTSTATLNSEAPKSVQQRQAEVVEEIRRAIASGIKTLEVPTSTDDDAHLGAVGVPSNYTVTLPHIIGSADFYASDDVGLGPSSSTMKPIRRPTSEKPLTAEDRSAWPLLRGDNERHAESLSNIETATRNEQPTESGKQSTITASNNLATVTGDKSDAGRLPNGIPPPPPPPPPLPPSFMPSASAAGAPKTVVPPMPSSAKPVASSLFASGDDESDDDNIFAQARKRVANRKSPFDDSLSKKSESIVSQGPAVNGDGQHGSGRSSPSAANDAAFEPKIQEEPIKPVPGAFVPSLSEVLSASSHLRTRREEVVTENATEPKPSTSAAQHIVPVSTNIVPSRTREETSARLPTVHTKEPQPPRPTNSNAAPPPVRKVSAPPQKKSIFDDSDSESDLFTASRKTSTAKPTLDATRTIPKASNERKPEPVRAYVAEPIHPVPKVSKPQQGPEKKLPNATRSAAIDRPNVKTAALSVAKNKGLFDSDSDDDLFASVKKKASTVSKVGGQVPVSAASAAPPPKAESVKQQPPSPAESRDSKKTITAQVKSLFEDDSDDELFVPRKATVPAKATSSTQLPAVNSTTKVAVDREVPTAAASEKSLPIKEADNSKPSSVAKGELSLAANLTVTAEKADIPTKERTQSCLPSPKSLPEDHPTFSENFPEAAAEKTPSEPPSLSNTSVAHSTGNSSNSTLDSIPNNQAPPVTAPEPSKEVSAEEPPSLPETFESGCDSETPPPFHRQVRESISPLGFDEPPELPDAQESFSAPPSPSSINGSPIVATHLFLGDEPPAFPTSSKPVDLSEDDMSVRGKLNNAAFASKLNATLARPPPPGGVRLFPPPPTSKSSEGTEQKPASTIVRHSSEPPPPSAELFDDNPKLLTSTVKTRVKGPARRPPSKSVLLRSGSEDGRPRPVSVAALPTPSAEDVVMRRNTLGGDRIVASSMVVSSSTTKTVNDCGSKESKSSTVQSAIGSSTTATSAPTEKKALSRASSTSSNDGSKETTARKVSVTRVSQSPPVVRKESTGSIGRRITISTVDVKGDSSKSGDQAAAKKKLLFDTDSSDDDLLKNCASVKVTKASPPLLRPEATKSATVSKPPPPTSVTVLSKSSSSKTAAGKKSLFDDSDDDTDKLFRKK